MKVVFYARFILAAALLSIPAMGAEKAEMPTQLFTVTPGKFLVFTPSNQNGLYFRNVKTEESILLSPGSGFISTGMGGRWLGFKWVERGSNQFPVLFRPDDVRSQVLPVQNARVGVPSFSDRGEVAYSDGNQIVLTDSNGTVRKRISMPDYANWTPISPDGKWVAYNDASDQIWVVSVQEPRKHLKLTNDRHAYFHPLWNHAATKLVFQSVDGKIFVTGILTSHLKEIGTGTHPAWSPDGTHIVFQQPHWGPRGFISDWDIVLYNVASGEKRFLTNTPRQMETCPFFLSNQKIAFLVGTQNIVQMDVSDPNRTKELENVPQSLLTKPLFAGRKETIAPTPERYAVAMDIPYVHQVYDTPSWFDGYWACGATSAIMVIAHYPILPKWSLYVNQPFGHRTYYGRYICTVYHTHRHTFNTWSYDRLGHKGYGGYGFITQKNWADTKGYMAKYFQYHGLHSFVDWYPAWGKLKGEIDLKRPFVLLNSLTSAGHYIAVVGYTGDRTVIVNDPYGDKNRGYTNYHGKQAAYDWPGYNNGNANLNTVWCFITARKSVDWIAEALTAPDTLSVGEQFSATCEISNQGLLDGDSVTAALYFSPDKYVSAADALVSSQTLQALAAGDTVSLSFSGRAPDSLSSRILYLGVLVDPAQNKQEGDRTNDACSVPVVFRGFPDILQVRPKPGSTVTQYPVTVEVNYRDAIVGIDTSRVQLFLNGTDVRAASQVSASQIRYTATDLTSGMYTTRVIVTNNDGFSREKSWNFSVDLNGAVSEKQRNGPKRFILLQNSPNPFKAARGTAIDFRLGHLAPVQVRIFNLRGETVKSWQFSALPSGSHRIFWNGRDDTGCPLPSGIYFLRIRTPNFSAGKRLVLLK